MDDFCRVQVRSVSFAGSQFEAKKKCPSGVPGQIKRVLGDFTHNVSDLRPLLGLQIARNGCHLVDGFKARRAHIVGVLSLDHTGKFCCDIDV